MSKGFQIKEMIEIAKEVYSIPSFSGENGELQKGRYRKRIIRELKKQMYNKEKISIWDKYETKSKDGSVIHLFPKEVAQDLIFNKLKEYFKKDSPKQNVNPYEMDSMEMLWQEQFYDDWEFENREVDVNKVKLMLRDRKVEIMLTALFEKEFTLNEEELKEDIIDLLKYKEDVDSKNNHAQKENDWYEKKKLKIENTHNYYREKDNDYDKDTEMEMER
ncbi:MAG: hypothetical protein ACRCUS_02005 [Anaerovoracaceae bacterium]